jgi:hypothetical protein
MRAAVESELMLRIGDLDDKNDTEAKYNVGAASLQNYQLAPYHRPFKAGRTVEASYILSAESEVDSQKDLSPP